MADFISFKVFIDGGNITYGNPSANFVGKDFPRIRVRVYG